MRLLSDPRFKTGAVVALALLFYAIILVPQAVQLWRAFAM